MEPGFDFDFAHVHAPFRMQPGLSRLPDDAPLLTPLDAAGAKAAEKRAVVEAGAARLCVPGFDPAPALAAIAAQARAQGLAEGGPPELAFEEDFAVLDGDTGTLPWLCVCLPSHWAPEDKLGLDFAALHAPVADGEAIRAASRQLVALVTGGARWQRHVWSLCPSPRHDQHPRRHPPAAWLASDDPQALAASAWLRAERQCFLPVPGTRQAVFTIRVMRAPLAGAVDDAAKARRLHDSLASMTEAVAAYKGLAQARPGLLRWLAGRMASQ